jgi:hypothetical protein
MLVVLIETWPSQARMLLMSTPVTRWQAVVCRIRCGVIVLPASSPGRATLDKAVDSEAGKWRSKPADNYGVIARATEDLVCQFWQSTRDPPRDV